MTTTLITGKSTFKLQVPYKLIRTGEDGKKPLLVYFHGYGQDIAELEEKMSVLLQLDAYHLFIQGPYALKLNPSEVKRKGYSYYLYDDDDTYKNSIEYTAEFIQEIIDHVIPIIQVSRISLIGYSMGAYLAGYWALTRWKHTNDVIMISGRLKTEWFESRITENRHVDHMNIIAFHGKNDSIVDALKQRECIEFCKENGLKAEFHEIETNHELNSRLTEPVFNWLINLGYRKVD